MRRGKKSYVIRHGIQLGEKGFKPRTQPLRYINLGDLDQHLEQFLQDGTATQQNGNLEINLARAGYQKLLSQGTLTRPAKILILKASEQAIAKVKEAGGEIAPPTKQGEG